MIEDLEGRRAELREDLATTTSNCDALTRSLIDGAVRRYFFSISYLLRQYLRREDLTSSWAKARFHFRNEPAALADKQQRDLFLKAVERTATLRRVESLIYLHRLLRVWLAPHVISTSVMLALMMVHIVQVVFFKLR